LVGGQRILCRGQGRGHSWARGHAGRCLWAPPRPPPPRLRRAGRGDSNQGAKKRQKQSAFKLLQAMLAEINSSLWETAVQIKPSLAFDGDSPDARDPPLAHQCERNQLASDNGRYQQSTIKTQRSSSGLNILATTCESNSVPHLKEVESNCDHSPVRDEIRQSKLVAA